MKNNPAKEKLFFRARLIVLALVSATVMTACGGGSSPAGGVQSGTGALAISMGDGPLDNLVKFEITVVNITLNPGNVSVLPQPVEIELTSLALEPQLIRLASNIPAGNYTSITIQFSNPEIKFCPDPPTACTEQNIQEISPPLQNVSVTINVNFSITGDATSAVVVDFDLRSSVVGGTSGPITGVNPMLTAQVINVSGEPDEVEAEGRVVSVNRTSDTAGTFVLELFENCQQTTFTVDSSTAFEDFNEVELANSFASLVADQFVEVEADLRSDGTLLAKKVELAEESDNEEIEGLVLSVQRDGGGAATSFTLLAQQAVPCTATIPTDDTITVTVSSSSPPAFRIDANEEEESAIDSNLFNDPTDLAVGQKVEVDPMEPLSSSITAQQITLKRQTIRGAVSGTPTPPTFELNPFLGLFDVDDGNGLITVITSSQTEFDGVTGVSSLTNGREVAVKGLLFLNAGQLELVAEKVDATP